MPQTVDVSIVQPSKITSIISQAGVDETTAIAVRESFTPIMDILSVPLSKAASIVVTDVSQKDLMKQAKDLAKEIATARIACEKTRKALKEESLKRGNAIQDVANFIKAQCEAAEEHLEAQVKFAERKEAERKYRVKIEREVAIMPYGVDLQFVNITDMSDEQFNKFLESSKLAHEAKIAAAKKAEEDRIAAWQARAAEDKRIREENEALRKQTEEQAKIAAAERAKAEAQLKAAQEQARKEREAIEQAAAKERAAREALEAQARQKAEAEAKALREAEKAAKAAAKAPDKEKINRLADVLAMMETPECSTVEGRAIASRIDSEITRLVSAIRTMANTL